MNLLNYIYINKCINCGANENITKSGLCENCFNEIDIHIRQEKNHIYFLEYNDKKNSFIYKAKDNNKPVYIKKFSKYCGKLINNIIVRDSAITFVPLHKKDIGIRGFNQSEIIASQISKYTNIELKKLLIKVKYTKKQKFLNKKERKSNLANAFKCIKKNYRYNLVYLVDDICSTKSTLNECEKILLKSGIKKVIFITLAYSKK